MVDVVRETASNFKSDVGRQYSVSDVQKVCDGVSSWIEHLICQHKGVLVPGLGTFTLSEWTLNTGLGKPLILCHPTFFLAGTLVQSFSVGQRHVYASNTVVCHMIHYGGVAVRANLDYSMVRSCVQEVTQALKRLLWEGKDVSLKLGVLGKLHIKNKQVTVDWDKRFLNKVRNLTERRRVTERPVHPWSPKRILD